MSQYHLRRTDRDITGKDEIIGILKGGKYATIAMSSHNEPYIVTLNYGYDEWGNCLYFHCALLGQKLDFLKNNAEVCATIIKDGGYVKNKCEHVYASVILRGEMKIVDRLEDKKHGLDILLQHLEENPEPIKNRNILNDFSYDRVNILCLRIQQITAKKGK